MANNQQRYYRGQYSPQNIYQQQQGGNDIISMFNPQAQAQFIDAATQRQGRFDTAKMAEAQEIARIGELETYDMKELNNRLKSFESNINSLVKDKYNGDYSAAANEIAKQIGTERTNPFYHFNKQKVEAGKAYLDAKMKLGVNFMETNSPFDVNFEGWQQGQTFEFTPVNRNDVVQNSASVFKTLADSIKNIPEPQMTQDQRFMQQILQRGFNSPEEVRAFITSDPAGIAMMQQVRASMPELAGVKNQQAAEDALVQGAYAAIGRTEVQTMANPDYIDAYQRAQLGAKNQGPSNMIVRAGILNTPEFAKELKTEQNNLITEYKNSILQDVLKNPKYASVRDKIKTYADVLQFNGAPSMSDTGTGTGDFPSLEMNPLSKSLNDELNKRADTYFSGNELDSKGVPVGLQTFKINNLPRGGMTTAGISLVNNIQQQFEQELKPWLIGEKLPPNVTFATSGSRKNSKNMDPNKEMSITNFGVSPFSSKLIFGISGTSSEGKRIESKVLVDAGSNGRMEDNMYNLLERFIELGQDNQEFMQNIKAWAEKFYPKEFE